MAEKKEFRHRCELRLLVCEPNPLRPDRVTVGFVLRDTNGDSPRVEVRLAPNLRAIQCICPDADLKAIEGTLVEMEPILRNITDFEQYLQNMPAECPAEFCFLPGSAVLTNSIDDELALLAQQYLSRPKRRVKLSEIDDRPEDGNGDGNAEEERSSQRERGNEIGRPYIRRRMQEALSQFGLWNVLQKDIPASDFTFKGNPLKIDFGYRSHQNDTYVMMHAVSVVANLERATNLALSWSRIRQGIVAKGSGRCELFGIIEDPKFHKSEASRSAIEFMQSEGLNVRPVSTMPHLASDAAIALGLF